MDIIDQLREIKNANDTSKLYEIYNYFFSIPVPIIPIIIPKGEKIVRARLNDKKFKHFNHIDDLFCPPKNKTTIQRFNIAESPLFYGAKFVGDTDAPIPRAVISYEISKFLRDNNSSGIQRITYSVWEVVEDMTCIVLPFGNNYNHLNKKLVELEEIWHKFVEQQEFDSDKIKIRDFISSEISEDNNDYYFTSNFGHFACNILDRGHDGIAFPTVKLEGDGLNVAITPDSAVKKLRLIGATESYIIKRKMEALIINVLDAYFSKKGKIDFRKRKDYIVDQDKLGILMSGLKFIN